MNESRRKMRAAKLGVILEKEKIGNNEEIKQLKNISPVAWRHIHFYGRYNFQKKENKLDISAILEALSNQKLLFE